MVYLHATLGFGVVPATDAGRLPREVLLSHFRPTRASVNSERGSDSGAIIGAFEYRQATAGRAFDMADVVERFCFVHMQLIDQK